MRAASKVFLELGYAAASVDEIARRARSSKATVYGSFGGKEGLFGAVVKAAVERRQPPDLPLGDVSGADELVLVGFLTQLVEALLAPESLALLRVVVAESGRTPALARLVHAAFTGVGAGRLTSYLQEAAAAGRLVIRLPDLAALQLLGLVKEVLFWPRLLGVERLPADQETVIAEAVRLFLAAHRPLSAAPGSAEQHAGTSVADLDATTGRSRS